MRFEFATTGRIIFGAGVFSQCISLARNLGQKVFLICGRRREQFITLFERFSGFSAPATTFSISGEPDTEAIEEGLALARRQNCDVVLAIGGGSVLDAGKAIAALVRQEGELLDYLEVVGQARPLERPKIPLLAVPTTAGTGAEATGNAVILSKVHGVKVSLRHAELFPTVALVDPELSLTLPPDLTAASGLDALTQLIESFVSPAATPFSDILCRDGLLRVGRSLAQAYADGANIAARTDMSLAALESGMALANAKLGAVHGLAGPLGGMIQAAHGSLCAALLPAVMEVNIGLLKKSDAGRTSLAKYGEASRLLTGSPEAEPEAGAAWVKSLCLRLAATGLSGLGFSPADLPALTEKALKASSMKGNPVKLSPREIEEVIHKAY